MVMCSDRQAEAELAVFQAFALVCPLLIRPESIEKRPTPEPDILCHVEGQGAVAFELTQIVDQDVARRFSSKIGLQPRLRELCQELPAADQAKIKGIDVFVAFREGASQRRKERIAPKIIAWLTRARPSLWGDIPIPDAARDVVRGVKILRGDSALPQFEVSGSGECGDDTVARIVTKLARSYGGLCPKELLAYHGGMQGVHPPDGWKADLNDMLARRLPASPFRRVWVFDQASRSIMYVYPQPASH